MIFAKKVETYHQQASYLKPQHLKYFSLLPEFLLFQVILLVHLIIEEIMYELAFFDPIRSLQDMKDSSPQYLFEKNFILIPLVNELAVEKIVKSGEYHLLNDKMNI